jgi:uncharacterized protein YecT (DUF1311 family)
LAEAERLYKETTERMASNLAELDRVTGGRYRALITFREAQRNFELYREANCKYYAAEMASGTGAGDVREACLLDMTRARITEIEMLLHPVR